ncbi:beta-N-acetylhexosaminidase [Bacteroides sp. OttesenSCG-928-J23]|nr:beta-N-acetylhexosaminidase [Bacteroides sp. OttesenSCG-928-N06]MDL2247467.1 beta-N-acetylhexosaminidase [Bacteroides sp. OttesenSCG-928-J23]MDL2299655.1 beta-N-acetylhexosaminidase [Bacteroides sp. OttesenSCG-928-E20]MDL2305768.1 beta-N-acetylhexosaminidase [Bacteroides sp. OttesenSCG-928-D19]
MKRNLMVVIMMFQLLSAFSCTDKNKDDEQPALPLTRVAIIPQPESLTHGLHNIPLPGDVAISTGIQGIHAQLLKETLATKTQSVSTATNEKAFVRVYVDNTLKEEGYRINIDETGCNLYYKTSAGMLWGIQTLRQIILQGAATPSGATSIPLLTLTDAPQKTWRGFHIDVVRHTFTLDYLKKIVDCLSFYKINKLQMHLTDDQGWRIEIKKYPTLTSVGGWRQFDEYDKRCIELANTDNTFTIDSRFIRNGNEYGGYYTQQELKDFINYAIERGIDVIPEIDMPGHFSAAIRAFPELSCTGQAGWGHEFSYPVCAGKVENYQFFTDILNEVADLFPSKYFHVGGDEVEKDNWKKCPHCQQLIREQNLMNVDGLQNYFIKHMADYVRTDKGKQVMAWDDAFIARDPQDLLYTYWRDWMSDQPGKITQQGLPLVFMEWGRFYLSATPSDKHLKSLYEFEFEPQFPGIVKSNVVGFQACVWTEMIPNERKFGQHVFPALQAFAEVAWGSQRDWGSFTTRIPWHLGWLTQNGLHSRTPDFMK